MSKRATVVGVLLGCLVTHACVASAVDLEGRVVDSDGKPVAEAVVFVDRLPAGASASPLDAGPPTAEMDQVHKQFVPHVLPVVVGTEVSFPNRDQIHHHVYSFSRTKTFELPLHKGEEAPPVSFENVGAVKVGCNIHDTMAGVIVVVPTRFHAVTDAEGRFSLRGVPEGSLGISAWHERQKGPEVHREVVAAADAPPIELAIVLVPGRARSAAPGGARGYE